MTALVEKEVVFQRLTRNQQRCPEDCVFWGTFPTESAIAESFQNNPDYIVLKEAYTDDGLPISRACSVYRKKDSVPLEIELVKMD